MTAFNDVNYAQSQDNWPPKKVAPGEKNTRVKCLSLRYNINSNLSINDTIEGEFLPEGAKVVEALMKISGSLGTAGIFTLGLRAGQVYDDASTNEDKLETFSADPDALVGSVDAGGQAALVRSAAGQAFLGGFEKKVGKGGLQVYATCTEAPTSADSTPRELEAHVFYTLEH